MLWKKETVVAVSPKEPVIARFSPLSTFECPEMRSTYIVDQIYYLRKGNKRLKAKLEEWLAAGTVKILED